MKIFTTQELRDIDKYTIENDEVSSLELIERVAEGVSCEIASQWSSSKPIVVFAGPGNNGADALATARLLSEQGYRCQVFLFNIGGDKLSSDCAKERNLLMDIPTIEFTEIRQNFALPTLTSNHIVIDGLFGSGLRRPLSGGFVSLVRYINESGATVVSIDVPSGLMGEWNPEAINRNIIHADLTLCVQFPRLAFFIDDYAELVGEWRVLDIELNHHVINAMQAPFHLVEQSVVKRMIRPRQATCSKADLGSAILYAGSYGMLGAAVLAARGASRSGAGKVTVYAPRCANIVLQTAVPEVMYADDPNSDVITRIAPSRPYDAIGIGPGISTEDETMKALDDFLASANTPLVLDADALNCIAERPAMLNSIPVKSIITPHAGEFDRLFGAQPSADARLRKAIDVARTYNIYVLLKGRYTAIVRPDGRVFFNGSGCPALATAGSGDVLTGLITGLVAQGYSTESAAVIGAYVHGLAGNLASKINGEMGVTATDIAENIGRAFNQIVNNQTATMA